MVGEPIEQCAGEALGGEHAGPLVEGQVAGDDGRAALVALAEDLEQQLGAGRRQRHVAQLVDDQQLVAGELALQAQQTLFIARLVQLVDQGRGGGEADRETLLTGGQSEPQRNVGYVVSREPWKIRKEEGASERLQRILYGAAEGVRLAAVLLSPFIPATSRKIFETFGLPARDPGADDLRWGGLALGAPLPEAPALFPRADIAAYLKGEGETMKDNPREEAPAPRPSADSPAPAAPTTPAAPPRPAETAAASPSDTRIGIEEFQKIRLLTGKVLSAERVPKSNKLIQLQVDLGTEQRQIVAGIAGVYEPAALVGRNVVVVANLKPAKLMGVESNGMVLAATVGEAGEPSLLEVAPDVPPGCRVK